MLNSTTSSVVKLMLNSTDFTQQKLSKVTGKSLPSISRALSILVTYGFVQINYHAPGKTWSIKNKSQIISFMKYTHPRINDRMTSNMVEMLSIFSTNQRN